MLTPYAKAHIRLLAIKHRWNQLPDSLCRPRAMFEGLDAINSITRDQQSFDWHVHGIDPYGLSTDSSLLRNRKT